VTCLERPREKGVKKKRSERENKICSAVKMSLYAVNVKMCWF
jgi:hypothetical protein